MTRYTITSLFSGCGGLDLGFRGGFTYLNKNYKKLNFRTVFANDIDKNACLTYSNNLSKQIICRDINTILMDDQFFQCKTDIVIGGFPCQDFSYAGNRKGLKSERGNLYKSMCKVISKTQPKVFLAENVKGLLTIDKGNAIKQIIKDFNSLGYEISYKLLKVSDFGVPQKRERIIIIGTKKNLLPKFDFVLLETNKSKLKQLTIQDAINDLEYLAEGIFPNHIWSKAKKNNGQGNIIVDKNKLAPTIRAEHHGNIEFHWNGLRRLSAREVARIQTFPDNFIFHPSTSSAYRQIGNAVPPLFAWCIAKTLQEFLDNNLWVK